MPFPMEHDENEGQGDSWALKLEFAFLCAAQVVLIGWGLWSLI